MRILIVEDQKDMASLIGRRLTKAGFDCDETHRLDAALEALRQFPYELMLLDRRLPDGDGAEAVPAIRSIRPGVRILLLTALDAPSDRVTGLDAGADDYLTKPFDGDELLARIRARLRRPGSEATPPIVVGNLSFDLIARQFFVSGGAVTFYRREFSLLESLVRRVDRVVTRATLIEEVYGFGEEIMPGALDTLMCRLRKRLVAVDATVEIHMIRGSGYILTSGGT